MPSCKQCKSPNAQLKINLNRFCDYGCAAQYGKDASKKAQERARSKKEREVKQSQRQQRKSDRERLAKLKSRSEWLRELQAVFNKYIRLRDEGNPCISCGRHHQGQYHAGHYLSVGAHPELRFNEKNCNLQCQPCNTHLSGNLLNYRVALIKKIGLAEVEMLEGPQPPLKLTIPEIQALIAEYKAKIKAISHPTTSTNPTC